MYTSALLINLRLEPIFSKVPYSRLLPVKETHYTNFNYAYFKNLEP